MGVFDGGSVAAHVDGVHDGKGAADSEDEAEEDADERAGEEVHDDVMVCPALGVYTLTMEIFGVLGRAREVGRTSREVECGWW